MVALAVVAVLLICGVIAGIVHWFTNPGSTVPTVGASGAIAGVLGAYFYLFPYSRVVVLIPLLFFPFFFAIPSRLRGLPLACMSQDAPRRRRGEQRSPRVGDGYADIRVLHDQAALVGRIIAHCRACSLC